MVLKLYTVKYSGCGRRAAVILHEKKIPYELIQPTEAKEIKATEWTKNHPFGQMPYIDDDGFILFESVAIARYLATKYASSGTPLLPKDTSDTKAMALLDQAISVESTNFDPYATALFREKVQKPTQGLQPEEKFISYYETVLSGKMDGFERLLSKQKYMAGDSLTFVDFFYLPYGNSLAQNGYTYFTDEVKHPNIARWWKEISTRDSWVAVKDGIPPSL